MHAALFKVISKVAKYVTGVDLLLDEVVLNYE